MPAIVFLFAGMARSYGILFRHTLSCDYQWPIRFQPCGDMCTQTFIADLCGHRRATFRPYPYQTVPVHLCR